MAAARYDVEKGGRYGEGKYPPPDQQRQEEREWVPWAVPLVVAANIVLFAVAMYIDNFAHIGGFLTGFLLGFIFPMRPHYGWMQRYVLPSNVKYTTKKYLAYQWVLLAVASVLVVIGFAVGMGMLFKGANANDHCTWCHYLRCVPTSRWSCGK